MLFAIAHIITSFQPTRGEGYVIAIVSRIDCVSNAHVQMHNTLAHRHSHTDTPTDILTHNTAWLHHILLTIASYPQ